MAKQIFTWYPDEGSDEDIKPDVAVTKFEGYEQRVPIGINSEVISWNLIFSGTKFIIDI